MMHCILLHPHWQWFWMPFLLLEIPVHYAEWTLWVRQDEMGSDPDQLQFLNKWYNRVREKETKGKKIDDMSWHIHCLNTSLATIQCNSTREHGEATLVYSWICEITLHPASVIYANSPHPLKVYWKTVNNTGSHCLLARILKVPLIFLRRSLLLSSTQTYLAGNRYSM